MKWERYEMNSIWWLLCLAVQKSLVSTEWAISHLAQTCLEPPLSSCRGSIFGPESSLLSLNHKSV